MNSASNLRRIARLLRRIAVTTGLVIAIAPPAMFGHEGYSNVMADLQFRSDVISKQIAKFANIHGDTWIYSFHGLPELIQIGDPDSSYRTVILKPDKITEIFAQGPEQPSPALVASADIIVRGNAVGHIFLSSSGKNLLTKTLLVGLVSMALGILAFQVFNKVPYRILTETIRALEEAQNRLAGEVVQKNLEAERANEATKIKSNFLANMSHEMRTPLNAIIGFSDIMRAQMFGPLSGSYAVYANDIYRSGTHLLGLVNSLLDLAKIEHNKFDVTIETVSLRTVITESVDLLREQARFKKQEISIHLEPGLPEDIISDRVKIHQILINLLSNSVKFTSNDGQILVQAKSREDRIEIAVVDNGVGMTDEEIELALEPFGQVKNAMIANAVGTGLGLPIVASFIQILQGEITISSGRNQGTRVSLLLPLVYSEKSTDRIRVPDEG